MSDFSDLMSFCWGCVWSVFEVFDNTDCLGYSLLDIFIAFLFFSVVWCWLLYQISGKRVNIPDDLGYRVDDGVFESLDVGGYHAVNRNNPEDFGFDPDYEALQVRAHAITSGNYIDSNPFTEEIEEYEEVYIDE